MKFQDLQNFVTQSNGCRIAEVSSQNINGQASNVLNNIRKKLWITTGPPPQSIILDLSHTESKPQQIFNVFGLDCWYDYPTNPKEVQVSYSNDGKRFESAGKFSCKKITGWQFFETKDVPCKATYLKLTILNNFGDQTTYINQILLSYLPSESSQIDRYLPTKEILSKKDIHSPNSHEKEFKKLKQRVDSLEQSNLKLRANNKTLTLKVEQMQQKISYLLSIVQKSHKVKKIKKQDSQQSSDFDLNIREKIKLQQMKTSLPPAPKMSSNKHQINKKSLHNTPSSSSGVSNYELNQNRAEKEQERRKQNKKIQNLTKQLEEKKRQKKNIQRKIQLSNQRKRTSSDYGH